MILQQHPRQAALVVVLYCCLLCTLKTEVTTRTGTLKTEVTTRAGTFKSKVTTRAGTLKTEVTTRAGTLKTEVGHHESRAGRATEAEHFTTQ